MDDLPLDTDRIQRYMISIPSLSGGQMTTTAAEGTIIPVQVALDSSQSILVPAVNMIRPQFSPPAAHQQTSQVSPTLMRMSPKQNSNSSIGPQGNGQLRNESPKEDTPHMFTVEDLSRQRMNISMRQNNEQPASEHGMEVMKDISELVSEGTKHGSPGKSDLNRQSLHSVISHLITTQTAAIMKEDDVAAQQIQYQNEASQGQVNQRGGHIIEIDSATLEIKNAVQKITESATASVQCSESTKMCKEASRHLPMEQCTSGSEGLSIISSSQTFTVASDKAGNTVPVTLNTNPLNIGTLSKELSPPISPALSSSHLTERPPRGMTPRTSPPIGSNIDAKSKVRHRSHDSNSSGSMSPSLNKTKSVEKKTASRNNIVPAPPAAITYDKFGATLLYDYTLPDRGLGLGSSTPRPVSQSSNSAKSLSSWHCPQSPAQLSIPSPALSDRSGTSPLDLSSANPKENRKEATTSPAPEQVQIMEEKSLPQRVLYEKNMLIFSDNEVEIISVGNNKWVVRNESQLLSMAHQGMSDNQTVSQSNKRPSDDETESPVGLKVPRLKNGSATPQTIHGAITDKTCVPLTNGNISNFSAIVSGDTQSARDPKNCPVLQNMLKPKN